jgi:WD40 repeat protein
VNNHLLRNHLDFKPRADILTKSVFLIALQSDVKMVLVPVNMNSESIRTIDFHTHLVCVVVADSLILAGSKSGIIYAWDIEKLQPVFDLKGHISSVNSILIVDDRLFCASDDKTIIE